MTRKILGVTRKTLRNMWVAPRLFSDAQGAPSYLSDLGPGLPLRAKFHWGQTHGKKCVVLTAKPFKLEGYFLIDKFWH